MRVLQKCPAAHYIVQLKLITSVHNHNEWKSTVRFCIMYHAEKTLFVRNSSLQVHTLAHIEREINRVFYELVIIIIFKT